MIAFLFDLLWTICLFKFVSMRKQAKKKAQGGAQQPDDEEAGSEPAATTVATAEEPEGQNAAAADAAAFTAATSYSSPAAGPSTAVAPTTGPSRGVAGAPAAAFASAAAADEGGPRIQNPAIIRPVILRPVAAARGNAGAQSVSPAVSNPGNHVMSQGQALAVEAAAVPAAPIEMDPLILAAIQRARRIVDEAHRRKKGAADIECIVCFGKVTSPVRLKPCGHVQMCSRCCKGLIALAESNNVEPQVRALKAKT